MSEIAFLFLHLLKNHSKSKLFSAGKRIFSSTQRELFQTEISFRKLGRILMDSSFSEFMEYLKGLLVFKFVH